MWFGPSIHNTHNIWWRNMFPWRKIHSQSLTGKVRCCSILIWYKWLFYCLSWFPLKIWHIDTTHIQIVFTELAWLSIKNKNKNKTRCCYALFVAPGVVTRVEQYWPRKKNENSLPFPASFPPRQTPRIGKSNEGRVRISKFFFPKWPVQRTQ